MVYTYVGPMFSGKSDSLINIYQKMWNKDLIVAFKPKKDSRDGAKIKSKNYKDIAIEAIPIANISEIKEYVLEPIGDGFRAKYRTVFIDEAQLLEGDVTEISDLSVLYDINFYIAGLNMTSEQKPFGKMGDIMAISDAVENIKGFCQDCNKESRYTYYYLDDKTEDVLVGDAGYISLCEHCLRRRRLESQKQKVYVRYIKKSIKSYEKTNR